MQKKTPVLLIDEDRVEVFVRGKRVHVSPSQFRILVLLRDSNRTMSRNEILKRIHGDVDGQDEVYLRTVDQQVARLRRALRVPVIETVTTFGYKFIG